LRIFPPVSCDFISFFSSLSILPPPPFYPILLRDIFALLWTKEEKYIFKLFLFSYIFISSVTLSASFTSQCFCVLGGKITNKFVYAQRTFLTLLNDADVNRNMYN
jgi:hypothetical protein